MKRKTTIILTSVTIGVVVAAGLAVLIWWLVTRDNTEPAPDSVIHLLPGGGIGALPYTAAFTSIRDVGDIFWWFYPSVASAHLGRPIVLWLDGVTGLPPSLLANLGMIGPYDFNLEQRNNSWINHCNLLFIDSLGTGFSTPLDESKIPRNVDENVNQLLTVLQSFYSMHVAYRRAPLYIFGQGDGAKSAVALALKLNDLRIETVDANLGPINIQGIVIGNGIIAPATAMLKLGVYLEELGYIDSYGRNVLDEKAQETYSLVSSGNLEGAFENFITLGDFVNSNAGAVAVNLQHIVEKLTRESQETLQNTDYFGQSSYIRNIFGSDGITLMNDIIRPALGINSSVSYDINRDAVVEAARGSFMTSFTNQIETVLQTTTLKVCIYNGNLDAVTNTPGQLDVVDNLRWYGQTAFRNTRRRTLVVNRLVEGYFRKTDRLTFYWVNAAGLLAPLDSPAAMLRFLPMMIGQE